MPARPYGHCILHPLSLDLRITLFVVFVTKGLEPATPHMNEPTPVFS